MEKIIQLTHTDIHTDARILKQIDILQTEYEVFGFGFSKKPKKIKNLLTIKNHRNKLYSYYKMYKYIINIDATYIQSNDWYMLPIALLHRFRYKSKVIYDAHELESSVNTSNKFRNWTAYLFEILFIKYVDIFITVSESILDWYKNEFKVLKYKKTSVINNVPNLSKKKNNKYEKNNGEIIKIVYVGGIESGRGIEKFINLINDLNNVEFHLFGYGSKETIYKSQFSTNKIFFHGKVSHYEILDHISIMDFGLCLIEPVSLSDKLCLPNKLFEYYNSNLQIIGSDLPEISNFINANNCGFILPDNATKETLHQNLIKHIDKKYIVDLSYSWDYQKIKYLEIFNEKNN